MTYTFVVYGQPAMKGSTVSFVAKDGTIVTHQDCKTLAAWTRTCGWAARAAQVRCAEFGTAVRIQATFQFVRSARALKRPHPYVRPDIDKVARALLDALTGIAYVDDGQVVSLQLLKIYGPDARTTVLVEHPFL